MRELRPGIWHRQAPQPDLGGVLAVVAGGVVVPDRARRRPRPAGAGASRLSELGNGLEIWLGDRRNVTGENVVERLGPLLELPIELVLPAHRKTAGRDALERALS
jgi:hypothetical protein